MRDRSRAFLLDAVAPLLLEIPPGAVGSGAGRPIRKILMRGGYRMLVDLRVEEQREAWRTGLYEPSTLSLARRLVQDDGVFLDIGANVGFYACAIGSELGRRGGRVFAFEPESSNRRRLRRNVTLNRLAAVVTVLPFALGERPGRLVVRRVPIGDAANAVGENMLSEWDRDAIDREGWTREEVDLIRLDDWSSRLERCDVIKVDVEGADLAVLTGGISTIMRFRPVILAEFNPYWMKQIGRGMGDIRTHAGRTRYEILRLFGERFRPLENGHVDRDDEVPSYVLIPEERASEIVPLLAGEEEPESFPGGAANPARIRRVSRLFNQQSKSRLGREEQDP
jgi:FkbM family methyltransferase